jgi:hypothetical protein
MTVLKKIYISCFDKRTGMIHFNITLNIDDFRRISKLLCGFSCVSKRKLFYYCCNVNKPLE